MKICFKKTKLRKQKQKKSFLWPESNPRQLTCKVTELSIAPRQLMLNKDCKLSTFPIMKFCRRTLTLGTRGFSRGRRE